MDKSEIREVICQTIMEISPFAVEVFDECAANTNKDIHLVDLGINSIDYCEVANCVMSSLNIHCSIDTFVCTNSLSEIVDTFYQLSLDSIGANNTRITV